jgi:hypothetical protein
VRELAEDSCQPNQFKLRVCLKKKMTRTDDSASPSISLINSMYLLPEVEKNIYIIYCVRIKIRKEAWRFHTWAFLVGAHTMRAFGPI